MKSVFVLRSQLSDWWTITELASHWSCSYRTAMRWLRLHPDHLYQLCYGDAQGVLRHRYAVRAGLRRDVSYRGNPLFLNGKYQRALVLRRWKRRRLERRQPYGYTEPIYPQRERRWFSPDE